MNTLFIDYEMWMSSTVRLSKLSLRRYLAASHVTGFAYALNDAPPVYLDDPKQIAQAMVLLHLLQPDVVVAHNEPFDGRVWSQKFNLPHPKQSRCTLDLAHAAYPNHPGGYSLGNLCATIAGLPRKLDIDLAHGKHTPAALAAYCIRDVECMRALYHMCIARMPDSEITLADLTADSRHLSLRVDHDLGQQGILKLAEAIADSARKAAAGLGLADLADMFGLDGIDVKSVKPHHIKDQLFDAFGFQTTTISKKKINPEKLRLDPQAAAVLDDVARTNAALSHKRRISSTMKDHVIDLTLRYAGSHTFRWTSTAEGRGINWLNLPKHDPVIAPLVRGMLSVELDGVPQMLVRGDAASLEYRINGWLFGCHHIEQMYTADVFADAYVEFGYAATNVRVDRKSPVRQVWKTTVLGLGFLMGTMTHALNIARLLASAAAKAAAKNTQPEITIDDLKAMCVQQGWSFNRHNKSMSFVQQKTSLDQAIIAVAFFTHGIFHEIHPEFRRSASWLEQVVTEVSRARDPVHTIDAMYQFRSAPDRRRVDITFDPTTQGRSVRVACGPWAPTLQWRDIGVRKDSFGQVGLCSVRAGNKGYRRLTQNILIENIAQAGGRNAMSMGMTQLRSQQHKYILNVHDEGLIAVPRDCAAITRARADLIAAYEPGGYVSQDWEWACIMDPREINVSRSLYEVDVTQLDPNFWGRVESGDDSVLDLCP